MKKFWRQSKVVEAVQWRAGDQFIGPMRWDYRSPEGKPYYEICGGRVYVKDGDWIVYEAGSYYPVSPEEFEREFVSVWDWSEYEAGREG